MRVDGFMFASAVGVLGCMTWLVFAYFAPDAAATAFVWIGIAALAVVFLAVSVLCLVIIATGVRQFVMGKDE